MKQTTNEWMLAAEDDLLAARSLLSHDRLTNIGAFHCQQCIEKCFKAVLEERDIPFVKTHDLLRLKDMIHLSLNDDQMLLLRVVNELYMDSRYPGDFGLLPNGKPNSKELHDFIELCEQVFQSVRTSM